MKRQCLFVACTLLLLTATSCQDEVLYSCNPEIDKWTKSNLSYIQNMTYADFLSFNNDINIQKSIYVAMSSEQKTELWKRKIEDVLKLSWNEEERLHIESLLTLIEKKPYLFDSTLHENYEDEIDLFSYHWIDYAKEKLGWEFEIYAIGMTLNPVVIEDGQIIVDESYADNSKSLKTRSEIYACNCKYGVGCSIGYSCIEHSCQLVLGCGLMGLSDCTGMCGKNK